MLTYVDSSVLLADFFVELRAPAPEFWDGNLASSRLLTYEVWTRIYARGIAVAHAVRAQGLLARVTLTEMSRSALARALEPYPIPVRTLDAIHLATIDFLRREGEVVELASYDNRMLDAAQAMGVPIASL